MYKKASCQEQQSWTGYRRDIYIVSAVLFLNSWKICNMNKRRSRKKKNCNPHLLFKLPMHPQKNALLCCCIPIPCFLPSGDHLYSHKPCTTRLTCLRPQLCRFLQRLGRCRVHVLNLLDQKLSLVNELFIFGPIFQKMLQELQKSFTIYQKDLLDGNGFMGICYENFEDVKAFILDHFAFVSEEIHTYF